MVNGQNLDGSLSLQNNYSALQEGEALGYGTFQPNQILAATHQTQQQTNAGLNVPFSYNYMSW